MLGQIIDGRYKVVQNLGSGGFGHTYIAEDTKVLDSKCVVKQLKPLSTDPTTLQIARRLFDSEAKLLHSLGSHDQIPQLLAYFEEDEEFYLVQQFIDGHPLSNELFSGKKWSEADVISLLQNILLPLNFVHENQVIHRDIKPPNLIRRKQDNKIVLIDFGAVKQIGAQVVNAEGETKMTVSIGTPGYMPSEQGRGTPRLSSDIYAVGIIGIQALTGLMTDQLREDPHTAEIIWRDIVSVSPRFADILDKMVRYDFRERFQSAQEVLEALRQLSIPCPPTVAFVHPDRISEPTIPGINSPQKSTILSKPTPQNTSSTAEVDRSPNSSFFEKITSTPKILLIAGSSIAVLLIGGIFYTLQPQKTSIISEAATNNQLDKSSNSKSVETNQQPDNSSNSSNSSNSKSVEANQQPNNSSDSSNSQTVETNQQPDNSSNFSNSKTVEANNQIKTYQVGVLKITGNREHACNVLLPRGPGIGSDFFYSDEKQLWKDLECEHVYSCELSDANCRLSLKPMWAKPDS
ncbi:MAG: serine/threonine-protein kinase [Cyanobacteria bacterium P01_A01_bin.45]